MFYDLLDYIVSLPGRIRTWPRRFAAWVVRMFWAFVAWLRALPHRIKNFIIWLYVGVCDQLAEWWWSFRRALARFLAPIVAALSKALQRDPSTIPPAKLKLSQRGRKIAVFSRQLASMMGGGVPLVQALDVLSQENEDPRLGYVVEQIARKLTQGYSFSKACSEYSRVFPPVFYYLMRAGESTGRIHMVVARLADLLEAEEDLMKRARGALTYPLFVGGLTLILTIGLFSTVLPGFAGFYRDFEVPLPAITATIMKITDWMQSPWFWAIVIPVLIAVVEFTKRSWAIPEHRLHMYRAVLFIPMAGRIIELTCLARYCWVMELTQDAGLDFMRSLHLAAQASGSATLLVDAKRVVDGITDGEACSELMKMRPDLYPALLRQMLLMGEETSHTSEACGRAARWFEMETQARIDSFQAALEPILMGGVSLVVGTIVLAVFLPLYGLLDKLGA